MLKFVQKFLRMESAGGLVLMAASILALSLANSPLWPIYEGFVKWYPEVSLGGFAFSPSPHFLINDGLMTVFFFMVGLEIKREILEGELSTLRKAIFPLMTAIGGVAAPALIFLWFNVGTENARGWAIAAATDIAFALGILSLFGRRVPYSLKIFLMALAVIDDLLAILIIAFFYTGELALGPIGLALLCVLALAGLNRFRVASVSFYIVIGFFLWLAVLGSGVHATMAGVILGAMIPMRAHKPGETPMGEKILHVIHPWVAFFIMPLFAFFNAGLPLHDLHIAQIAEPLPLGIIAGLFIGKQVGIVLIGAALVGLRLSPLPQGVTWLQFYATSMLAGIGFTMSLFIGALAFGGSPQQMLDMKLGVMLGSLISGLAGCLLMAYATRSRPLASGETNAS